MPPAWQAFQEVMERLDGIARIVRPVPVEPKEPLPPAIEAPTVSEIRGTRTAAARSLIVEAEEIREAVDTLIDRGGPPPALLRPFRVGLDPGRLARRRCPGRLSAAAVHRSRTAGRIAWLEGPRVGARRGGDRAVHRRQLGPRRHLRRHRRAGRVAMSRLTDRPCDLCGAESLEWYQTVCRGCGEAFCRCCGAAWPGYCDRCEGPDQEHESPP